MLVVAAVSLGLGCTRLNRNYCEDAPHSNCALRDGAIELPATEVERQDAAAEVEDVTSDRPPEVKPECAVHADCMMTDKPICDTKRGVCVACTTDMECKDKLGEPGLCVDGTCPTRSDVIVVNAAATCMPNPDGTPEKPFCNFQAVKTALEDANENRRIVVIRGRDMPSWNLTVTRGRVVVIGQPLARVAIVSGDGISLLGVDVKLRRFEVIGEGSAGGYPGISIGPGATVDLQDVTVRGSKVVGIVANMATSVRLNRVSLIENATGLRLTASPFDVTNTVIAGSTRDGAVLEGAPVAAGRFQNNTLFNNAVPLTCTIAYTVSALLVYPDPGLGMGVAASGCLVRNSNTDLPLFSTTDPARPYRLTVSSPCVGKGDPTGFPPDDIDGEPRPMGAASDCGADEFKE